MQRYEIMHSCWNYEAFGRAGHEMGKLGDHALRSDLVAQPPGAVQFARDDDDVARVTPCRRNAHLQAKPASGSYMRAHAKRDLVTSGR